MCLNDWVYITDTGDTNYEGRHQIKGVDTDWFEVETTWGATATGTWKTYQPQILFDEAPSAAIDYTLFYRAKIAYLGDTEVTWLLSQFPQLILYRTLLEAEPFIKNDPRVALWSSLYERALAGAKKQQWRGRTSGGRLVVRPDVPLPV